MPERVCCNTEFLPFRMLRAARILALSLTDPDRYRAIMALRQARRAALRLAAARDRRAIKACEASLHTHMQRSLAGRMKLSSRSLLPLVDEIFTLLDGAAGTMERPGRGQPRASALLTAMGELIGCLELQLGAASRSGAATYAGRFIERAGALREGLLDARRQAMSDEDQAAQATALTALGALLACICRTSHAAARGRPRRNRL